MGATRGATHAVGANLAAVLPSDAKPWYKTPHLLKLNALLFSCMLFSSTVGYDNSMMNGLQALPPWQTFMHHPKGPYLGLINATQAIGGFCAYPFMSVIAQKYGRKMCLYCGFGLIAIGTALQTAAQHREMFIVSRVFVGLSSAFFGAVPLLVGEVAYPTHRGIITAAFFPLYYVGSVLSAWATFGTRTITSNWSWRIPSVLQVGIPVVIIVFVIFAPESPRWLVAVGRSEEARALLTKYHAGGDESSMLVAFEMAEIEEALRLERQFKKAASYMDMFRTKGNRHRLFVSVTLGVFAQWNGVGIISYYLVSVLKTVGIASPTQQTLINGFLQLWNLIAACTAAGMVDKLGRRFLFIASSVGMLICYIIMTGLAGSYAQSHHAGVGIAVVPMLFLYYGFYDIAYTPLVASYPVEIWPYELRSRGVVVTHAATYAALFFNLFINPIALAAIQWKYYIVYVVILVFICITVFLAYPETRGYSLEEIAVVFDGTDAHVVRPDKILEAVEHNDMEKKTETHIEQVHE
ncbi:general substrate transporter [Cadophora sp. MPI-SDFR-AT-0126]|nr:general substrate transporter [Leotiomycetes sp. MPI-SDFR-AT-0126]